MLIARLLMWPLALMLLDAAIAHAQVPSDLLQAVRERQKAVEAADAATWDRLTGSDFAVVGVGGRYFTKAERLAALKQQKPQAAPMPRLQEQIKVYGNTAVERVRSGNNWVIQVWVRQAQGWQVVATQVTAAAQ